MDYINSITEYLILNHQLILTIVGQGLLIWFLIGYRIKDNTSVPKGAIDTMSTADFMKTVDKGVIIHKMNIVNSVIISFVILISVAFGFFITYSKSENIILIMLIWGSIFKIANILQRWNTKKHLDKLDNLNHKIN